MAKYHLTHKAVNDLTDIWTYTFKNWSEGQADDCYNNLIFTCERIAKKSLLGKSYNEILKSCVWDKSKSAYSFL